MTYSILGRDPKTGEVGAAVQSRASTVGNCVWARAGVGAVATQSFTETGYGPRGLDLLEAGRAPADALAELLAADAHGAFRQVAFLAADGRTAAHTGDACIAECGHVTGPNHSAQGNMLASHDVWPAAAESFERTTGTLAERLLAALDAAEAAGGDFRGRRSAALVVASGDPGDPPWQHLVDLRVDDRPEPLAELRRLHAHHAAWARRSGFGAETLPAEEVEIARVAGLPPDEVALTAALAESARGDHAAAAQALAPFAAADPRWRATFERAARLGLLPREVVDRL